MERATLQPYTLTPYAPNRRPMQADRIDLFGLFNADVTFVAPLFQRPYVWDREPNWEPLWEAVRGVAEQHLNGARRIRPHFLGAVVLNQLPVPTGGVPARELIDGQQRLTTLQLLLAAIRDLAIRRGRDPFVKAFGRLVENEAPLATDVRDTFKVWPTNADRAAFMAAVRPGSDGADGSTGPKITGAYAFFADAVEGWVGEGEDAESRLRALYEALARGLHLVAIDLDEKDGDDPQLIFETLNALGTPLLPADLVKNYLFQRVADSDADAVRLYNKYWRPYDEDQAYWRTPTTHGRVTRPPIDHYLQHYLTLQTVSDVPATKLFPTFKDFAVGADLSVEDHLARFHSYSETYRSFSSFPRSTPEGTFFYRLETLDVTTVYPLLLEVFQRLGGAGAAGERRQILTDIESFLVRREVCRLATRSYNRVFLDALERMKADFSAATLRAFLLEREGDNARWPDDKEFKAAWMQYALFRLLVRRRLRMILEALEAAVRTDKTEDIGLPPKLTVEHVMPQQWALHWPLVRNGEDDGRSRQERADARSHTVQTIGNLTLLTEKLNPSLSNGTWAKKRAALRRHSALALNREIAEHDEWDEAAIERRSADLFEVARRTWPYPH